MAGTIYTPITLWQDFSYELPVSEGVISEYEENGIIYKNVYVSGKRTNVGQVKIYGLSARKKTAKKCSAILILPNYTKTVSKEVVTYFAKQGYQAFMIDYGGMYGDKEYYTAYPEDIAYANASEDRDAIHRIATDVKNTCWYEWTSVARYAFYYLTHQKDVNGVGVLGIKHGATIAWQLAATEKDIKCMTVAFGTGWRAYRGYNKFSDKNEPEFDDELYRYLGAVEPQAYAKYVNCPTMLVTSTNNAYFDADRAYDTIVRVDEKHDTLFNYAVQCDKQLDKKAIKNIDVFFKKYLGGSEIDIPKEIEISAEVVNGSIEIKVKYSSHQITDLMLYSAEETINPSMRCYNMNAEIISEEANQTTFKYEPYKKSGIAFFFAQATYSTGFTICSKIIAKRFEEDEIYNNNISSIIYSAKENKYLLQPYIKDEESFDFLEDWANEIVVKQGPMNINGITCKGGIKSLKINNLKGKPKDQALFMLDIYSKNGDKIKVTLITDMYKESETEYFMKSEIKKGEVWHNLVIPINKFKTQEGMLLKSYQNVNAIVIESENDDYLINNVMWI